MVSICYLTVRLAILAAAGAIVEYATGSGNLGGASGQLGDTFQDSIHK